MYAGATNVATEREAFVSDLVSRLDAKSDLFSQSDREYDLASSTDSKCDSDSNSNTDSGYGSHNPNPNPTGIKHPCAEILYMYVQKEEADLASDCPHELTRVGDQHLRASSWERMGND